MNRPTELGAMYWSLSTKTGAMSLYRVVSVVDGDTRPTRVQLIVRISGWLVIPDKYQGLPVFNSEDWEP